MPRESAALRAVLAYAKSQGLWAMKLHGGLYGTSGIPDVLVLVPSQPYATALFIELKKPGEKPGPLQYKRLRDLNKAGAVAIWADNLEKVKEVIEGLKRGW